MTLVRSLSSARHSARVLLTLGFALLPAACGSAPSEATASSGEAITDPPHLHCFAPAPTITVDQFGFNGIITGTGFLHDECPIGVGGDTVTIEWVQVDSDGKEIGPPNTQVVTSSTEPENTLPAGSISGMFWSCNAPASYIVTAFDNTTETLANNGSPSFITVYGGPWGCP